jgi:hypothetical protein
MLLKSLPRLPFVCAFDILFRHGGIAGGLQRIFPSGTDLFEFMETVFGNGIFNETVRACHLVFRLECPAYALYLLQPVDKTIPESVGAWSVAAAHSDASWILPVRRDLMIHAVRVFLPHGPVYDWLHSSDFTAKRTMKQWIEFAREAIYNYRFTDRWWKEYGEGETMGSSILKRVEDEAKLLERGLWHDECRRMMQEKMDKRGEVLMEEESAPKGKSHKNDTLTTPAQKKKKPAVLKLSDAEVERAKAIAGQRLAKYRSLFKQVKTALDQRISTHTFDAHFAEIARLVMALAKKECRRMTWTFKAAVHHAAGERLGLESWHIERELCRQALRPTDHGALEKLCAMR